MGTWGVHQYRGSVAGHVFAVAAEKAQAAKEDARKPATERAQPKREWQSQQTRHALADALKEVLDDLRAGPVTGGPAPTQIEAAGGSVAASSSDAATGGSSSASDSSTSTSSATSTAPSTTTSTVSPSTTAGSATVAAGAADGDTQGADTTNRTDGGDGNHPVRHALHDFMHALFEALRPNGDSGNGQGRGFGWGRTTVADLAQRIEQLSQSFASPSSAPAASGDAAAPAPSTGGSSGNTAAAPVPTSTSGVVASTPVATTASTGPTASTASTASPVTTSATAAASTPASTSGPASTTSTSSAVTASSAPSTAPPSTASSTSAPSTSTISGADSSLLSAFDELLSALPGDRAATAAANPAEALSALLHRLAQALGGNGGSDSRPATGCLIHATA